MQNDIEQTDPSPSAQLRLEQELRQAARLRYRPRVLTRHGRMLARGFLLRNAALSQRSSAIPPEAGQIQTGEERPDGGASEPNREPDYFLGQVFSGKLLL